MVSYYGWTADLEVPSAEYSAEFYYLYGYGGIYGYYNDGIWAYGGMGEIWLNYYSMEDSNDIYYSYIGYVGFVYGEVDELYDLYYNGYWQMVDAVAYIYTWWWWGNVDDDSYDFSGVLYGYYNDLAYIAEYYVFVDTNVWTYAAWTFTYGSYTIAYTSYAYDDEDYTGLYIVGYSDYSWWGVYYDGHSK